MKSALNYLDIGLVKFNHLIKKREFWFNYLIIQGFFDIAISIIETNNNGDPLILPKSLGIALNSVFVFFVLSILSGKEEVFSSHNISLILRTIVAEFFAGFICLIGLLLFVIPGIILGIRYLYIKEAILIEGLTISQAFSRSRDLSSFNGGRIFKSFLIIAMIWLFVFASVGGILYTMGVNLIDENNFLINYLSNFTGSLLSIFLTSIIYSGYTDAYQTQLRKISS